MERGEDESDEGDDRDREGEHGRGLRGISLTPLEEEEGAGLLFKPDDVVKSMWQVNR